MAARRSKGEATYRKRPDGLWEGRISIEYKRYSRYGKSRTEAKEKIEALVKSLAQGVIPSTAPLGKWVDYWLNNIVKKSRSQSTYDFYEILFRVHITPELGKQKLCKLTEDKIHDFVTKKEEEIRKSVRKDKKTGEEIVTEKKLSATTINHIANALRSCLNAAVRRKSLTINPASGVVKPKIEQPTKKTLTAEEVKKLLDAAEEMVKKEPLYLAVLLLPYTGGRRGEVLGIRRAQVDLETPGINIDTQLKKVKGGKELDDLKTESSYRFVPVTQKIGKLLEEHMERQPKIKVVVKKGKKEIEEEVYPDYLFCHPDGTPFYPDSLRKIVKRILEKVGVTTKITPHELRHTYATLLLESGESDRVIAELMGHASLSMLKKYAHVRNKLKIASVNRLEEHIEKAKKDTPEEEKK